MAKKKLLKAEDQFSEEAINQALQKAKQDRDIKNRRYRLPGQRVGRNDYCPCGSGKKNKHCHQARRLLSDGKTFTEATYSNPQLKK